MVARALSAAAVVLFLSGCVYGGPGPRPGPGPVATAELDYYDGYYDGYYGPFVDGYWGGDGGFYYADHEHHWHHDDGGHFRRGAAHGFSHVHGSGAHREH